jgi:hypothetical protein
MRAVEGLKGDTMEVQAINGNCWRNLAAEEFLRVARQSRQSLPACLRLVLGDMLGSFHGEYA